jgi:hypothetical protein
MYIYENYAYCLMECDAVHPVEFHHVSEEHITVK